MTNIKKILKKISFLLRSDVYLLITNILYKNIGLKNFYNLEESKKRL